MTWIVPLLTAVLQTADAAEDAAQLPDPGPGHGRHLPAVAVAGEALLSDGCYHRVLLTTTQG